MPLDPEFVAETRAWLIKAHGDLLAADLLRKADSALRGHALFHCQQAAEKALKGFLTWHGLTFGKTHNLGQLGQAVADVSPELASLLSTGARLTDYAWKFRYPGSGQDPTSAEIREALTLTRSIYEAMLAELPREVRP